MFKSNTKKYIKSNTEAKLIYVKAMASYYKNYIKF